MGLFIPTYFSPISQYSELLKFDTINFEIEDNFQKQTYRNRCYIFGANGKQLLNIPIKHSNKEGKKKTKDTLVENAFPWQSQHLKSLQTAYRSSPFFEFYEDDLLPIFSKKYKFLLDVNIDTYSFLKDALQLETEFKKTNEYKVNSENDFRYLAEVKQKTPNNPKKYIQIFDDKHGYISNLSMLDLLFMEGPNAISYL
ncbi:WbqC-like protein [Lutibacter sp. Hel_I_33_5]|uniref:WbqC family protein n=1 Tax=Lutibacter sp. Hel_I_33_5 TaxID=1566289 RepID=UPI0011A1EAC3|nr:WbqC family protein [Lutibacter sp. Hel_I_33_5]TVZ55715.1 WbqC-like protein [Lutibacter sp. Hel_I_33_5]